MSTRKHANVLKSRLFSPATLHIAVVLFIVCFAMPAFAGTTGSTMGSGIVGMFNDILDFMRGPIVVAGATIAFIMAAAGAYFSGGSDAMKKILTVVAITAGIIAAPGIIDQVVGSAGAMI